MTNIHEVAAVAANLWNEGVRVVPVKAPARQEYLFAGCNFFSDCNVATFDSDFHVRMQQLPRGVAALIEQYLRLVRVHA
jgi:hypothetical protein